MQLHCRNIKMLRGKEVNLPMLDKEKVYGNHTKTQVITSGIPILLLIIFGVLFNYLRRKKYNK